MGLIIFLITWVGYIGLLILVDDIRGREIDLLGRSISGFFASIGFSVFMLITGYSAAPSYKYLENNDNAKPTFYTVRTSIIDIPKDFDFNRLKSVITSKWVVSYSDDVAHILKFRTKLGFGNLWGAAAWLKLDSETGKILIDCFPMVYEQSKLAKKLLKEIEESITVKIE